MNTYDDNLRVAIKETLSTIYDEKNKQSSAKNVAKFNVYFAVGSQMLAWNQLENTKAEYEKIMEINDEGVANSNHADNLMDSASIADQNVEALVTNAATVAQNVQVAGNAILKLASSIGSATNIMSASDYDTDLQKLTETANKLISETAYQSERASQLAMESSQAASQIISKQVLNEATTTKALFDDMLLRTQAELTTLTDVRINDTKRLGSANTVQRSAEGSLKVVETEFDAVDKAYKSSNKNLNFDLKVEAQESWKRIKISFNKLEHPFQTAPNALDIEKENKYFVTLVRADVKNMFSFDTAESCFNSYREERFFELKPGISGNEVTLNPRFNNLDYQIDDLYQSVKADASILNKEDELSQALKKILNASFSHENVEVEKNALVSAIEKKYSTSAHKLEDFLKEINAEMQDNNPFKDYKQPTYHKDADGKDIETGVSYVAFLYIELSNNYKKETNNFSDRLSAPSEPFALTENLKEPQIISDDLPTGSLKFKAEESIGNPAVEYRCILIPSYSLSQISQEGVDADSSLTDQSEASIPDWFNVTTAIQVSRINYALGQKDQNEWIIKLNEPASDNFGNQLIPSIKYIPAILSIVPENEPNASSYTPALTYLKKFPRDEATDQSADQAPKNDVAPAAKVDQEPAKTAFAPEVEPAPKTEQEPAPETEPEPKAEQEQAPKAEPAPKAEQESAQPPTTAAVAPTAPVSPTASVDQNPGLAEVAQSNAEANPENNN